MTYPFSLLGLLVGLFVGLTGVGGGSLMTPLLVLLFGIHPSTAVGTDLLFAAITKSVGTTVHNAHSSVDWRIVGRLATGSVPTTAATIAILAWTGDGGYSRLISLLLGVGLMLTALSVLFRRWVLTAAARLKPGGPRHPELWTVLVGAVLGVLVSLSSVGAGALGVTALILLYPRMSTVRLVGSDVAHAVPLTFIGGLGHWYLGSVNVTVLESLLIGSIPGIVLGSLAAKRIPDMVLRPILACTLLLVGGRLVA